MTWVLTGVFPLVVALRIIEKAESPIRHIHPVMVCEGDLSDGGRADFGLDDCTPHPDPPRCARS